MLPVLAIVVPCYNEEEALPRAAEVLADLLRSMMAGARWRREAISAL